MKTLDRYIFRELLKVFVLSVGVLTTILFLDKILFLTELIINKGVSFIEVVWMMIYISPAFLALTLPMSVLVASVVVFNQFSADSEIVAMKANGWSFLRLMRPVLLFSLLAYVLTNFIMFFALPWGNISFKKIIYDIVQNRAHFEIKPHVFNRDFDNLVLFAQEKKGKNLLGKIFIADSTLSETPKIILAQEGAIVSDPKILKIQLRLKEGTIHELSVKRKHYQILNFDRYDLTLDLPQSQDFQRRALKGNRELSLGELRKKIEQLKKKGKKTYSEEVELSKKFSLPFTCLIFAFIGAPLGIKSSRSGKSGGFVVCFMAILLYYMGLISTQNLGSIGEINPLVSVWIPNIITLTVAVYLVYKTHMEIPFKWISYAEEWLLVFYQNLKQWFSKRFLKTHYFQLRTLVVDKTQKEIDDTSRKILKAKMEKLRVSKSPRQV